jgi:hypothetical protein
VGKPNKKERYYYSASKKYKQQQNHISSQGKYLTAPNLSHRNLPSFMCQNRIVVRPPPYLVFCAPVSCQFVRTVLYGPETATKFLKSASKTVPKMPRFPCQIHTTVRICAVRPPTAEKYFGPKLTQIFLGICALFAAHFLSQAYSENLSQSPPDVFSTFNMSCTLPNAFFYNLKMVFSPQSVFSPSPTLDPNAKIRSCIFQDQGS